MTKDIIINTFDLGIGYHSKKGFFQIIDKINLICCRAEMIALIGENGSGKSTLLKTLARLYPFTNGQINFNHDKEFIPLNSFKKKDFAKKLSFVSTEIIKLENLTVYDLVSLGRFPYTNWFGSLSESDKLIINHSIELVGLENFRMKHLSEMSDGERQKAMIARSLAQDTEIIILDEPTAFLDLPNKYELFGLLGNLAKEKNKTIIFSTHDLNLALKEADKIWLISNGKIHENSPEDLLLSGLIESVFKNDRIKLDKTSGEFHFERKYINKIRVKGEGIYYNWTIKALNRIGYEVSDNKYIEQEILITFKDQASWSLKDESGLKKFDSIYDLIYELRHRVIFQQSS